MIRWTLRYSAILLIPMCKQIRWMKISWQKEKIWLNSLTKNIHARKALDFTFITEDVSGTSRKKNGWVGNANEASWKNLTVYFWAQEIQVTFAQKFLPAFNT